MCSVRQFPHPAAPLSFDTYRCGGRRSDWQVALASLSREAKSMWLHPPFFTWEGEGLLRKTMKLTLCTSCNWMLCIYTSGLPRWLRGKRTRLPMQETWVYSLGWEDALENEMATHSSTLAWRIPWTEEPGGRPSVRPGTPVRPDWVTCTPLLFTTSSLEMAAFILLGCCIYAYGLEKPGMDNKPLTLTNKQNVGQSPSLSVSSLVPKSQY